MERRQKRKCKLCIATNSADLDRRILEGEPRDVIAKEVGVTKAMVNYHANKHLREQIVALRRDFDTRIIAKGRTLLERVESLLVETVDILQDARLKSVPVQCPYCKTHHHAEVADIHGRVAAARQVGKTLELIGRVTGEVRTPDVTALFLNLGVRGEADIRAALTLQRSAATVTMEGAFDDAIATLELVLRERPDLYTRLAHWYGQRHSEADVVSANGSGGSNGKAKEADAR